MHNHIDRAPSGAGQAHHTRHEDPFWERWVPALVPAGLALVLVFALLAVVLMGDAPAAATDDQAPSEHGEMHPEPLPPVWW